MPVSRMTLPNGVTTTWSYGANRDLITRVQNGTISTYGYVNDAVGRRTAMSRSGSAYANPDTIVYTYNDRSELTGAMSNVDATYSYSYAYDPIGNRVTASEAGVSWTYTTNCLNQYTSATENNVQLNFSYDLDGSMTYRPVDATSGWTQVWNGENRMVETFKGTDRLTFRYDYMGRRVEKCVYSDNVLASRTLFVYDGFKCVEELDALNNNAVLMRHTWQPFDIGQDVMLATTDTDGVLYCLTDANKHISQIINDDKRLQSINFYSLFGIHTGNLVSSQFCFSSEIIDAQTSMTYFIFRYYASNIGRWINRDPIQEDGGIHIYAFCQNNPNMFTEHLGKSFWDYIPFVSTAMHLINRPKGIHPSDYIAHPPTIEDCCNLNKLTSLPGEDPEQRCIDDINNQLNSYWRKYINWGISSDIIENLAGGIITKYATKKILQAYLGPALVLDATTDGLLVVYNILSMHFAAKEVKEEKCKCKYN